MGKYRKDTILDTRVYDILFPDGTMSQYAANLLAENIWSQVDSEGNRYQIMDHVADHKKDNTAIRYNEAWMISKKWEEGTERKYLKDGIWSCLD